MNLLVGIHAFTSQLLLQVGNTQGYDGCNYRGVFHVFRNTLGIEVTFSVPDFTIVEVVSLEIAFTKTEGRYSVYCKYSSIGTTHLGWFRTWLGNCYIKWIFWIL